MDVIPISSLKSGNFSQQLEGREHGSPGLSLIFAEAAPGQGPSLHRHDYAEVMIIQQGTATFTDGETQRQVEPGNVVIIPAGEPHAFTNDGDSQLMQINIHASDAFVDEPA